MSNSYKVLSNSLVEAIYDTKEDKERFFREAKHNQFYRRGLAALIDKEIEVLVLREEEKEDDPVSNVAMRKALRHLKRLVLIGGLDV